VFSFANVAYPTSGFTSTLSPSSTVTGSGGTATTTFTPSNHAGDNTHITGTVGTSALLGTSADLVTTIAGAPSKVSFYFESAASSLAQDYLGNKTVVGTSLYAETNAAGTSEVSLALSDAFANPVGFGAVTQVVLTGVGGEFDQSAVLQPTLTGTVGGAGAGHFSITGAPSPMPLSFIPSTTYVQASGYGAVGEISASVTSGGVIYTGSSANLVTSALGTISTVTTNPTGSVAAGSSILVEDFISTALAYQQQGVPITLNLCTSPCATTKSYDGKFANGASSITLTTNNTATTGVAGGVQALMAVNTTLGSVAIFNATASDPTNLASTHLLTAAASAAVTTTPGAISTLVVNIAAGTGLGTSGPNLKSIVNGSTAYVDAAYADAYGNLVTVAPANQIQIGLAASVGALSATQVYIQAHQLSTNATGSFGAILWTLPNAVGTVGTITASANVNGKAVQGTGSLTTVSAYPSLNVTSPKPISGILYAPSSFVTFQGIANATSGSLSTTIATIGYKVGTGGWLSVSTTSAHNTPWTVPIVLSSGLNTVQFNVTDSAGKTTVSPSYQVLVDSSVPIFGTIKVVANTSANVNVTSAEGDLNTSSVTVTSNGTAVAASQISVTGTSKPGSSVTYLVTVSGLTKGTWTLAISAKTLAGLSGSTSGTVTITVQTSNPNQFTYPSTPKYYFLGNTYHTINVTITNSLSSSTTAIVFAVVHNSAGQTIEVTTSSAVVAAGATVSAYPVLSLASGTYSVTIFVWASNGASLSQSETVSITY